MSDFCLGCLVDRCRCDGTCIGGGPAASTCPCAGGNPSEVTKGGTRCSRCFRNRETKLIESMRVPNAKSIAERRCGKFGENGGCGETWRKCKCYNDLPGMKGWKDGVVTSKPAAALQIATSKSYADYDRCFDHAFQWYYTKHVRDVRSDEHEMALRDGWNGFIVSWASAVCNAYECQLEDQVRE